jgi:hypothetical protein
MIPNPLLLATMSVSTMQGEHEFHPFRCESPMGTNPNISTVCISWNTVGRKFEGLGALSGGGGTSRLLYDYEDP